MPQKPQNTISQTVLKNCNQLKNVRTEAIIWVKIATDSRIKLKVETTVKERDKQLLEFISIDILKMEKKHLSSHYIITVPMTSIIKSSFNKYPMSWELIHCRLLHPSESAIKAMCHYQTLDGMKNFP